MPRIQTGRRGRRVRVAAGLATTALVCSTLLAWPGGPEASSAEQESSAAAGDAPGVNAAPGGETSTDAVASSEARASSKSGAKRNSHESATVGDSTGGGGEVVGSSDAAEDTSSPSLADSTSTSVPVATRNSTLQAEVAVQSRWLSGVSGAGGQTDAFATWRGRDVEIVGTWADNNNAMTGLWQLRPGGEYSSWMGPLDIAIGGIGPDESWGAAALGAYDARWRESLVNLRELWGARTSPLFIRFAHELNGNWYPWSVDSGEVESFVSAWRRFRSLQEEVFPQANLVFCVNRESVGAGFDWRRAFPGSEFVDVMAVDYYNQYPYVATDEEWGRSVAQTDVHGAPTGLQAHLDFARSVGLPLGVSEWSGVAHEGDSPAFIRGMHQFFAANAGSGPGQVLYEVLFNIEMQKGDFRLYGGGSMPLSARLYRKLW